MSNNKDHKLRDLLHSLAAEFFLRESNRTSLITVTDVEILSKGSRAKILFTVMPEHQEQAALEFMHRQLTDFKRYVMDHSRIGHVPFFDVAVDKGEKNRQRIEEIEQELEARD